VTFIDQLKPTPLSADDRAELIAFIEEGARPSRRYFTLTVIASFIAAFGLITNSVATIVGAMIIEPSMGPIVGLALGLVRFNQKLKVTSLLSIVFGIVLVIMVGYLSGIAPVDMGITNELKVRSVPTLLDMLTAVASGLAAGYAYVNPKVNPALAGVAVAVSLAPPLAASGIFLAHAMPKEATGAFLIFFANLICIQLACVAVFLFYKVGTSRKTKNKTMYFVQFLPYILMTVSVGVYLVYTLKDLVTISNEQRIVRQYLLKSGFEDTDFKLFVDHERSECNVRVEAVIKTGMSTERVQKMRTEIQLELGKPVHLEFRGTPVDIIRAD
jgi:uncharacterized hydrophobic protein (TIGR00271 family)